MGYFTFRVNQFHIDNTRSRHNDTDSVALGLKIGDQMFPTQTQAMGDLNNGDYPVNIAFTAIPVPLDTTLPIKFNYQIVNAGHVDQSTLDKDLSLGAAALVAELSLTGIWGLVAKGAIAGLGELLSLLNADCDGPVAIDQISITGGTLVDWGAGHSETRSYPGIVSPDGCGSNSQYSVTWSIQAVGGQDNWRWCTKCQGLAFAGNSSLGPCPAGGTHDHTGSGNYSLIFG